MKELRKAYICSPLSAPSVPRIKANMYHAKEYMKAVTALLNCSAVAPHAYLPEFIDDNNPAERAVALEFGLDYLATCDIIIVCGPFISSGMAGEIQRAMKLKMPVYIFQDGNFYLVMDTEFKDEKLRGFLMDKELAKHPELLKGQAMQALNSLLSAGGCADSFVCLARR